MSKTYALMVAYYISQGVDRFGPGLLDDASDDVIDATLMGVRLIDRAIVKASREMRGV